MRRATALFGIVICLALASSAEAKGRPGPITCPTDVAAGVAEMCPCAGKVLPNSSVQPWRNHGQYVSCIVRFRNALRKAGCFTDDSIRRTLARCAARSTCGKATAVLCCHYDLGTCSDPMPGDMVAAGMCSNDATLACDTAADCTMSSSRIEPDANTCTADGGVVVVGGGSVCAPCPPPPGATTTTTTVLPPTTTTTP